MNSHETEHSVGNGWDQYAAVGPIDLDEIPGLGWGSGKASKLWLRIDVGLSPWIEPEPIDVRIGWIKLQESAP